MTEAQGHPPRPSGPNEPDLIIEVKGGVVTTVYTDLAVNVVVNDLDVEEEAPALVKPLAARK